MEKTHATIPIPSPWRSIPLVVISVFPGMTGGADLMFSSVPLAAPPEASLQNGF